ncbi:hypothetical protein CR513_43548, partial [Mucuna pruriens]
MKDKWCEAYDLFNELSGFAWSPAKRFEFEDEMREVLIKRLTLRQIHCTFNIHNHIVDFNDTFDETTMSDPDIGNFDGIQASSQNVESSPTFAQSNHSIRTFTSQGKKHKAPMIYIIKAQMDKLTSGLD